MSNECRVSSTAKEMMKDERAQDQLPDYRIYTDGSHD